MTIDWILSKSEEFRYQMLDRMRGECDYYLGYGMRSNRHLWAGDPKNQIEYMKRIWKSFDRSKKPEWLKYGDILKYEKMMVGN